MKVLLRNTQSMLGDRLMFTPVVRDLKAAHPDWQIGVESIGPEVWMNNPHIVRDMIKPDAVYQIGPGKVTRGSKTSGLHITEAFRCSLQEHLGEPIKQGPFKPDIFLSETEKKLRFIDGPYWVINIDCGPMSAKRWPRQRWQQVVDELGDITFVQVGLARDNQYRLRGPNIIDMVNQTKIRELFSLVYNAEGCVSLISSLMHVAAAFEKPCVVLAGAREPPTFERYASHRFIDMVGCLPCASRQACWHNAISACKTRVGDIARCMDMVRVDHVVDAVKSYYEGGRLTKPQAKNGPARLRPLIRIVTNAKCLGGAERSVIEISRMFCENNWRVEISSANPVCSDFKQALPGQVVITNHISRPCDILLFYASDMVFNFDQPQFEIFGRLQAKHKVMALTYKIGKAGVAGWTKGWDRYLFLSSTLRDQFCMRCPDADTAVLAPPVDLEPFLKARPVYDGQLRIVRLSSQGDCKFPADLLEIMAATQAHYRFMPGPSWLKTEDRIQREEYSNNPKAVADFLSTGSCFWYLLPAGYTDQGPRVIVEAMTAGLPVIAENRDGPKDRVTEETGWLIDSHDEVVGVIAGLTPDILKTKGHNARRRAKKHFQKEFWFEKISEVINNG
jgi:ADP-heptose:LPS heptosyltransferase